MTILQPSSNVTDSAATQGAAKSFLANQRQFIADFLGSDSTDKVGVRMLLGALLNSTLPKSGAYTVGIADVGKVIQCNGTWTLGVDDLAVLGDGFAFGVWNVGTGTITIDPYLSTLIDGATTKELDPGELLIIYSDGTRLATAGGGSSYQQFRTYSYTSSGAHVVNADVDEMFVFVSGATGGFSGYAGSGGVGGAGYAEKHYANPAASYSFTVGAGGGASSAGGTTTFDTISISGSGGGAHLGAGGAGGVASGGDFNANGGSAGAGHYDGTNYFYGGGGAGGSRAGNGGNGASAAGYPGYSGGGGGTGGSASGSTPGIAATSESGSAIALPDFIANVARKFSAGSVPGGASGIASLATSYPISSITGGAAGFSQSGRVFIIEVLK